MNSLAFVTHPSVRIKGSENNYSPSLCLDERCPIKAPHMHCPFCVKTDAYQDPVILKAHYRVKHVDKGIEFAGLKILRCCDHCDIVGIIKGEKRFKGAHWHCYRCRNGFNRRDEAIKHYKTHFRNPQTTFQIQITQDLNLPPGGKSSNNQHQEIINHQQNFPPSIENPIQDIIHPVLSQASLSEPTVINADGSLVSDKFKKVKIKEEPLLQRSDNHTSVPVDQGQTIMIIQGDNLESAFADHIISGGEVSVLDKDNVDPSISWEIKYRMEEDEKNEYKARMEEYKSQVEVLQQRIQELESQQSTNQFRVQDLLTSLSLGDESKQQLAQQISKYLEEIQSQDADADLSSHQGDDSQQEHLIGSEGIINQLTTSVHDQTDSDQLSSDVRTSLQSQVLQSHSSVVAQLSQINPYQVIATGDPNNQSIITSHNSEENPIPESIVNNDPNNSKTHNLDNDNINTASVTNISIEEVREVDGNIFHPISNSGSHNNDSHEIIVAQVVSSGGDQENMIPQKFLVDSSGITNGVNNGSLINIDGTVDNNRLLQVVAASSQGDHSSGTFIMETESGQQIIIQRSEEPPVVKEVLTHADLEPEPKRQRFLEEQ